MSNSNIEALVGDTPVDEKDMVNPFHLHFESGFRQWLAQEALSIALTTYEAGKLSHYRPRFKGRHNRHRTQF